MKVKLLRKLRRRFHWFRRPGYDCWFYYDRKENRELYAFTLGMYYVNDMLLGELLEKLYLSDLYVGLRNRLEARSAVKKGIILKNKYKNHFK